MEPQREAGHPGVVVRHGDRPAILREPVVVVDHLETEAHRVLLGGLERLRLREGEGLGPYGLRNLREREGAEGAVEATVPMTGADREPLMGLGADPRLEGPREPIRPRRVDRT